MRLGLLSAWLCLLLFGFVLPHRAQAPVISSNPCPFDEVRRVSCGTLTVPENRKNPEGRQIELAFALVKARGENPAAEPVIYLEGGPGGSALLGVEFFTTSAVNETHDIILLDQRGTGFSQPSLNCPEIETGDNYPDDLEACFERLDGAGIDLSAYNSIGTAADINDLRVALGYSRVNLWGISYGTRVALTVMRYFPDTLHAVLLDSVFPPEIRSAERGPGLSVGAMDMLFGACADDPACDAAYPDLQARFYDFVDDYIVDPLKFEYFDGVDWVPTSLYDIDFLQSLYLALYDSDVIGMLPFGVETIIAADDDWGYTDGYDLISGYYTADAWNGLYDEASYSSASILDRSVVVEYIDEYGDIYDAEGVFLSVKCTEEIPFESSERALAAAETTVDALHDWLYLNTLGEFTDCEIWEVNPVPIVESQRVFSDVPTLLVSGAFDPITPPDYAESALRGLTNARHIVFPVGAHAETGYGGCGTDLAAAFFNDPAAPLDTDCIPQEIEWYIED